MKQTTTQSYFRFFAMRTLTILVLLAVTLGMAAPEARAQGQSNGQLIEALDRLFQRATNDFADYGIDDTTSDTGYVYRAIGGAWLKKGEAKLSSITLAPGIEHVVIAATNSRIKKASLQILDAKKKPTALDGDAVLTESSEDDNAPGCTVNLDKAQYGTKPYTLGVRMLVEEMAEDEGNRDSGWVCYIVLQKEAGWKVSKERYASALNNLQARLDAISLSNGNGTGVARESVALTGVALLPNATTSMNTGFPTDKSYRLIAGGDDRAESLAFTLGGNILAPLTSELGTPKPRLIFAKDQPLSPKYTGAWKVVNKGKSETLILTLVVRIGR